LELFGMQKIDASKDTVSCDYVFLRHA